MTTEKFQGIQGSPEHQEHVARVKHATEVHDVIEALLTLDDSSASITDRADMARYLEGISEDMPAAYSEGLATYQDAAAKANLVALKAQRRPFNPDDHRIGDVFSKAPPQPAFVVDRLMPRAHGLENAVGGVGKTTRHIYEAAHIILGRDLYGRRVHQPGGVLFVTKEDDKALFRHRIHEVINSMADLSAEDRKRIAQHLHVMVLTGTDERLALADRAGNLVQTDLSERIAQAYRHEGLALVEFDPFNMFGPGERHINDAEAATLNAMARLSQSLRCAVRATSHVSKAVGRDGTSDAHSSRGGSAGGDNSRFVWNYWRFDRERDKSITVPPALAGFADAGDLYRLHIAKLTAAKPGLDRAWIVRQGFAFQWHADEVATPQEKREAAAESDAQTVLAFLRRKSAQQEIFTQSELETQSGAVGIGQKRIRAALVLLKARGMVADQEIAAEDRKGGRKTYLEPVAEAPAALDTSRPIDEQIT